MGLTINSFKVNNYGGLGSGLIGCCRPVNIFPTCCLGCGFSGYNPFNMFFSPFCSSNWMFSMLGFGLGWKVGENLPAIGKAVGNVCKKAGQAVSKFFKWVGRGFKSEKSKETTEQAKTDKSKETSEQTKEKEVKDNKVNTENEKV